MIRRIFLICYFCITISLYFALGVEVAAREITSESKYFSTIQAEELSCPFSWQHLNKNYYGFYFHEIYIPLVHRDKPESITPDIGFDLSNPESIVFGVNQALETSDISLFDRLYTDDINIWARFLPDGPNLICVDLMGDWCDISKNQFIQEMANRILYQPDCNYYNGENILIIETWGWSPEWVWPYGRADGMQFSLERQSKFENEYRITHVLFGNMPWLANVPCSNTQ